jgi:hypothetical protein
MPTSGEDVNNAGLQELWTHQRPLVAATLAALCVVALIARRLVRRRNTAPQSDLEERAWSFCPKCGWPRGRKVHMDQTTKPRCLPSAFLRQGWCREPALDADGRVVLPNDPTAVAWSLWGAANRAFDAGSSEWQAFIENVDHVLRSGYGESIGGRPMTVQRWNREPSRTKAEVVGVAMQLERLVGLTEQGPPPRI